jgi:hypothetical protein|tara:strand:- start:267 stop:488 length:222 start_codon:yes stop_codon:yes gene_type:complete
MINRSITLDRRVTVIGSIAWPSPASITVIAAAIGTVAIVSDSAKTGGYGLFAKQLIVSQQRVDICLAIGICWI